MTSISLKLVTLVLLFFISPINVNAETESLEFYVFSCPTCGGIEDRLLVFEAATPLGNKVFFSTLEENNNIRFERISVILDELLYLPLVGIFKDGSLIAVCSGALSENEWQKALTEELDGVPVYIAEKENQMKMKAIIKDPNIIEALESLFINTEISDIDTETNFLNLFLMVMAAMVAISFGIYFFIKKRYSSAPVTLSGTKSISGRFWCLFRW